MTTRWWRSLGSAWLLLLQLLHQEQLLQKHQLPQLGLPPLRFPRLLKLPQQQLLLPVLGLLVVSALVLSLPWLLQWLLPCLPP